MIKYEITVLFVLSVDLLYLLFSFKKELFTFFSLFLVFS